MNKNFKFYAIIWAVLLALFNVITFVVPEGGIDSFEGTFWVGYIFITLAFLGQLAISYFAFQNKNAHKFFYSIPLIHTSWTGLVATTVIGSICMLLQEAISVRIGIVLCFVVLGLNIITIVKASAAANIVGNIDDKIKTQTFFIKALTVDAQSLVARTQNEDIKAECKKVYEAVRYSDPMSNNALSSIESQITIKFNDLSNSVSEGDFESVRIIANELVILISDRNNKCKLLK